ncbi:MAG: DUF2520 domain-containing protein [Bacteroidales bacterium]|nr:DUF2520 domain-containing protein [Bacteroidales bacterium]
MTGLVNLKNIVLIGAGNVATHLGLALKDNGYRILQVYSRTIPSASHLAGKLHSDFSTDLEKINLKADLYIISVPDDAVGELVYKIKLKDRLVVHTSGSLPMDILKNSSSNYGVVYPLQTFSKTRKVDFEHIPICVEANSKLGLETLKRFAGTISGDVRDVNSEQRKKLHLAAVFACNFPNFMYSISAEIVKQANIDFSILRQLIKETAEKVMELDPLEAQTGPAKRGDQKIMEKHLEMLKGFPEFKEIYQLLSERIEKGRTK